MTLEIVDIQEVVHIKTKIDERMTFIKPTTTNIVLISDYMQQIKAVAFSDLNAAGCHQNLVE